MSEATVDRACRVAGERVTEETRERLERAGHSTVGAVGAGKAAGGRAGCRCVGGCETQVAVADDGERVTWRCPLCGLGRGTDKAMWQAYGGRRPTVGWVWRVGQYPVAPEAAMGRAVAWGLLGDMMRRFRPSRRGWPWGWGRRG